MATVAWHAAVFAALVAWSWRKWPDPLIDFGRELYVPWQITRGKVLYRDIASLFGPLSPYVNALWMRVFGVSLMTLAACNMCIFAVIVAGIYRLIRFSTDRFTATAAALTTLLLFGFLHPLSIGNYNFVTPYSHEATHGMALAVGTLLAVRFAIARPAPAFSMVGGLCFGLLLLTKPETPLAVGAGVFVAWTASAAIGGRDKQLLWIQVPLFVVAAFVPAILSFTYFRAQMNPVDALRATGGAWTSAIGTSIARNQFYMAGMGLDRPVVNLLSMVLMFVGFVTFVAVAMAISRKAKGTPSQRGPIRYARLVLLVTVLALTRWLPIARGLPLVALMGLAATVIQFIRCRRDRDQAVDLLPLIMWSAFALVLLAKMGLNARLVHYGFYLALPATTVGVVLVFWLIPRHLGLSNAASPGAEFRRIAAWALVGMIAPYLGVSNAVYQTKTLSIGSSTDRFYAASAPGEWQGSAVRDALDEVDRLAASGTVAVLPEGVMLNYLSRRDSPLRVVNLMPPELLAFGEDDVLQSLEAAPPDLVLLVHKDVSEYGYPLFGTDVRYGERTLRWLESAYEVTRDIGSDPMSASGFGIRVLRKK
jgi:hypothetical protein